MGRAQKKNDVLYRILPSNWTFQDKKEFGTVCFGHPLNFFAKLTIKNPDINHSTFHGGMLYVCYNVEWIMNGLWMDVDIWIYKQLFWFVYIILKNVRFYRALF